MADQSTTDAEKAAQAAAVQAAVAQLKALDDQAVADVQAATAQAKADIAAAVAQMKQVDGDMLAAAQGKPLPSAAQQPPAATPQASVAQEKPGQPVAPAGPT